MANSDEVEEITSRFQDFHRQWKDAEKGKEKAKKEISSMATELVDENELATRVVTLDADSEEELREFIEREYPEFEITDIRIESEGKYDIILKENPEFKPWSHVTQEGWLIQRQVTSGSTMLDDERIKEEDPELYAKITKQITVVKPLEEMDGEVMAELNEYIYRLKPGTKIASPRKAKPEEIE